MQTVLLIADDRELSHWLEVDGESALDAGVIAMASNAGKAKRRMRSGAFECVCCDLETIGLEEGLRLQEWTRKRRPGSEWLWIVPAGWPEERLERLDGCPYLVKPLRPGRLPALLSLMLQRGRERREMTIAGQAADYWMLPIRIGVRKWRTRLTAKERQSLEFALGNAADELIRYPNSGITASARGGIAVLLFDLPSPSVKLDDIKRRCRQFRQAARQYFYADVVVSIGATVPMRYVKERGSAADGPASRAAASGGRLASPSGREKKLSVGLSASDMAVLQQIFSYVDENLPTELKREEIADLVHFHPVYLSRFFKSRTGTSLSQYIVNRRIEKAKALLSQSELQVSHIVHRLGYYNPSHFTRTFKQATGFTPSQYRSVVTDEARSGERPRSCP